MNKDLKVIKKYYGEDMMHLCREYFPIILENAGLLSKILLDNFNKSHDLYADIMESDLEVEFKNYIFNIYESLLGREKEREKTFKTPEELMSEAGYYLYECFSEEDIQSFRKYYQPGEELCTFNGGRLNRCRVFFAVKKNVAEIKREDFLDPKRQDLYGTSVISIQFTKDGSNTLSIKNRYNHRVANPDSTFSNNLDNIIPGLTASFEDYYGIVQENINERFEIPGYVRARDGKYYKYNYEFGNVYYCPDNIIIDNYEVKKYPKEKYLIIDYFIINLQNKTISLYKDMEEGFLDTIGDIERIEIKKNNKDIKIIYLTLKNGEIIEIKVDNENRIIGYKNNYVKKINNRFLRFNTVLKEIELPNVISIGDNFLHWNLALDNISLPNVRIIGRGFLYNNEFLERIELPKVMEIGWSFLRKNIALESLSLPNAQRIDNDFLCRNQALSVLNMPNVIFIGDNVLYSNGGLRELVLPKVEEINSHFMFNNLGLRHFEAPNLTNIGQAFLYANLALESISLPSVKGIEDHFLAVNRNLSWLELPNVEYIGDYFLCSNKALKSIELPKIEMVGNNFLSDNETLRDIPLPFIDEEEDLAISEEELERTSKLSLRKKFY